MFHAYGAATDAPIFLDALARDEIVGVDSALGWQFGGGSIMMLDPDTDELVFESICGAGQSTLVGSRFPATAASRDECWPPGSR